LGGKKESLEATEDVTPPISGGSLRTPAVAAALAQFLSGEERQTGNRSQMGFSFKAGIFFKSSALVGKCRDGSL
jgi:hypothetical protein